MQVQHFYTSALLLSLELTNSDLVNPMLYPLDHGGSPCIYH